MVREGLSNLSETNQKGTSVGIEWKSNTGYSPKRHVNWRKAAICAMQIELCNYAHLLDFYPKYILDEGGYCIDLLVTKKAPTQTIPKNFARIFETYNLFKIKGFSSSMTINDYYVTISYACLLVSQLCNIGTKQYSSLDVTVTLLTFRYPRKLMNHLQNERELTIRKISPGIYHIDECILKAQIIVTSELSPDENLCLSCLTDHLQDSALTNRLSNDYTRHIASISLQSSKLVD